MGVWALGLEPFNIVGGIIINSTTFDEKWRFNTALKF